MNATGKVLAAASCIFVLLRLSSAEGLSCSVIQDHNQTTYIIYDVGRVLDPNATDCEHMWSDANDVNLGNQDKSEKTHGVDMHVESDCLGKVVFTRNCLSEGVEYKANCTIICRERVSQGEGDQAPVSWIPPVVIVLLLAVVFAVLYCKFIEKLHRWWNCGHFGGLYTSVKFNSKPTECVDVEAGN